VELQYYDLTAPSLFDDSPKMLRRPSWVRIACGGYQQRVVFLGIEGRAYLYPAVRYLGLHAATRKLVTQLG
jgi:hypothetical protein